jgi:hypothetical protein
MNTNTPFCQSCGMPMNNPEDFGNEEYCCYCFKDGVFTLPDITMEQMIEKLVPFALQMGMTEDQARKMGYENLPKLKRWNKNK